jgi:hypothetical protein
MLVVVSIPLENMLLQVTIFYLIDSFYFEVIYLNLDDRSIVNTIFSAIGSCDGEIDENLLNVVTALSGGGPAYVRSKNRFV